MILIINMVTSGLFYHSIAANYLLVGNQFHIYPTCCIYQVPGSSMWFEVIHRTTLNYVEQARGGWRLLDAQPGVSCATPGISLPCCWKCMPTPCTKLPRLKEVNSELTQPKIAVGMIGI